MPYEHLVDHGSRLVVVRGTGEGSLEEATDTTRRLLEDPSIGSDYRLMIVDDDIALYPTPEEMSSLVSLLGALRARISGRMAIVTSRPGRVTTSLLVAFTANSRFGNVQAFTSESDARAWLLAAIPP